VKQTILTPKPANLATAIAESEAQARTGQDRTKQLAHIGSLDILRRVGWNQYLPVLQVSEAGSSVGKSFTSDADRSMYYTLCIYVRMCVCMYIHTYLQYTAFLVAATFK